VARHEEDDLAVLRESVEVGVGEAARVGELLRRRLDRFDVLLVLLRRDDRHDHVLAECGLAEDLELDARRRLLERLEVGPDLPVIGERAVGADVHLQKLRRRRRGRGMQRPRDEAQSERRPQDEFHCAKSPWVRSLYSAMLSETLRLWAWAKLNIRMIAWVR